MTIFKPNRDRAETIKRRIEKAGCAVAVFQSNDGTFKSVKLDDVTAKHIAVAPKQLVGVYDQRCTAAWILEDLDWTPKWSGDKALANQRLMVVR